MSSIRKLAFVFASSLILSIGMTPAHAVNLTWDNDTDGSDGSNTDFNNPFNWGPGQTGTVPGAADNANFGGAAVSNPNVTAADTIQGLTFLLGSSGYTLSSSGPSLTLTNTGTTTTSAITALNASGTNTISGPIILGGNASTTATFTQAAGGTLVVSGNISSTNLITGLSLSSSANTGIFTLSGTTSYNGSTTLGAATLNLNSNSALGTGNLIIGSASAVINNTSGSAKTLTNNISFNNTLTFTGTNDLTFGQLVLNAGAARN